VSVFFEILAGFILGILAEIPGGFIEGILPGFFNRSRSENSNNDVKRHSLILTVLSTFAIIIGVLYFGALIFRHFNG